MGVYGGPEIPNDGLVLALDGANYKSFKGEVTTNLSRNSRDFSGTAYASSDEWVSSEPTRLTKTYISSIVTPIGNGATLIQESGNNGYHHLSRWGGGDESGAHSLSCYVFPLTSDITDFVIGMLADGNNQISFNLNTGAITYGPGISNRDAFITPVVGFDGWYRVGANIEGRYGGWVGSIGYTTSAAYTGTSGNKKCYITGIQYESKSSPTSFVEAQTTRGATVATGGGWADLTGNGNNGELVNGVRESSANGGSLSFDGTDDYVTSLSSPSFAFGTGDFTLQIWIFPQSFSTYTHMIALPSQDTFALKANVSDGAIYFYSSLFNTYGFTSGWTLSLNTWNCVVFKRESSVGYAFLNGVSRGSKSGFTNNFSAQVLNIHNGYPSEFAQCKIAQVSVYNRALTAAEISQNYNALRRRFEGKVFYYEGNDARNFVSNWNDQEIFNMTTTADLGNCYIHGWGGSPRSYTLALTNLPTHTEVRYECYIHMVDSLDNETSEIYTRNSAGTESLAVRWTKQYNQVPNVSTLATGMLFPFKTGQTYSYRPWGNGAYGNDGYASFDTGFYAHTGSNFSIRHYFGADQGSNDEAYYISHVKLTIRYL